MEPTSCPRDSNVWTFLQLLQSSLLVILVVLLHRQGRRSHAQDAKMETLAVSAGARNPADNVAERPGPVPSLGPSISSTYNPRTKERTTVIVEDLREATWPDLAGRRAFTEELQRHFELANAQLCHAQLQEAQLRNAQPGADVLQARYPVSDATTGNRGSSSTTGLVGIRSLTGNGEHEPEEESDSEQDEDTVPPPYSRRILLPGYHTDDSESDEYETMHP